MRRATFVAAGATALAAASAPARGAEVTPIRVIGFISAATLPLWIADAKGLFTRENLAVTITGTPGSVYQFQHLSAGDFEVALTAFDNIVAYDEGQGDASLPNPPDFVAFVGGDSAFLQLWARPGIKGYADLKGTTLAVDALSTGFAFVLRKILAAKGLGENDYRLEAIGATQQRLTALQTRPDISAALLSPPFTLRAKAAGMTFLDVATDVIGRYQGNCVVARRAWLAANRPAAVRFTRAYVAATTWLHAPGNRAEAAAILAERAKIPPEGAAEQIAPLLDPVNGIDPRGAMTLDGVRTVLALRSTYAVPKKTLSDPSRYVDVTVVRDASV